MDARGRYGRVFARATAAAMAAALGLATASCGHGVEKSAHAGPSGALPEVTVALPLAARLGDFSERTGRAEAVESVEVRARASGYLQRVSFREGALVKKGDLLFTVDPRPYAVALTRARAELERAGVDEALARRDVARAEQLFKGNSISERERDTQSAALLGFSARTHVAEAAVSSAELDVDYTYVRAPISGRVGRIQVTQGNLVGPSLPTPLTTIVSVDPLHVYVDVDEAHALRLGRDGGQVAARVGFADEREYPHEAAVDFVDNRVDPQSGTLKVRVVVKNPDGRLTPGLFARVRLPDGGEREATLVSDRAIATDQDRRYVLVVGADDKVVYRPVQLGPLHDGLRVVREGVSPTDRVIVRGLQRVRPGAVVKAETIAMTRDLGARPGAEGGAERAKSADDAGVAK